MGKQVSHVSQDVAIKVIFTLTSADLFYSMFAIGIICIVFLFSNRLSSFVIIEAKFEQDLLSFCIKKFCQMDTMIHRLQGLLGPQARSLSQ